MCRGISVDPLSLSTALPSSFFFTLFPLRFSSGGRSPQTSKVEITHGGRVDFFVCETSCEIIISQRIKASVFLSA